MEVLLYFFPSLCVVITCVIVISWFSWKLKHQYWKKMSIKYLEPVPYFGNIAKSMLLLNPLQEVYEEIYKALINEPYGGYYELNIPMLLVNDPKLIHAMLVTDFKHFVNRGRSFLFTINKTMNPLSSHVATIRGERWKALRQKISPMFSSGKIKQMHVNAANSIDMMNDYIEGQMLNGRNSADIHLKDLFERLAMHVITTRVFGAECISFTSSDEFQRMMTEAVKPKLTKTIHRLFVAYSPAWLSNIFYWPEIGDEVISYFRKLSLNTVEYRRLHGIRGNDMLQSLIDLQNSHVDSKFAVSNDKKPLLSNDEFDEIDIMANSFVLMFAAFETTSTTLTFCVYELALNVEVQRNLRSEVQMVKEQFGQLSYDSLQKMNYMDAVIAETLRKYPVTVAANRECTEDYIIPGSEVCIPKGTNVKFPTWSLHHDWRYYPNPEKFDPERFIGDNKSSIPNGAYLAFGDGPRSCVGKRFAEVEMKAVLSDIILNYDIEPCLKTEIPLKFKKGATTLQCESGTWVNLTKRKI